MVTKEDYLGAIGAAPYHQEARVNLISQSKLVDIGCKVIYNAIDEETDPDSYTITDQSDRSFTLCRGGCRDLYGYDIRELTMTPSKSFPTVAGNIKQFTKSEVESAKDGIKLQSNLGHYSVDKTVATLPSILNCTVTRQDILNKVIMFEHLISHLEDELKHIKNAVLPPIPDRRFPQDQEGIVVDLMYIRSKNPQRCK